MRLLFFFVGVNGGELLPLTFRLRYDPTQGYSPIHELENRNAQVQRYVSESVYVATSLYEFVVLGAMLISLLFVFTLSFWSRVLFLAFIYFFYSHHVLTLVDSMPKCGSRTRR